MRDDRFESLTRAMGPGWVLGVGALDSGTSDACERVDTVLNRNGDRRRWIVDRVSAPPWTDLVDRIRGG